MAPISRTNNTQQRNILNGTKPIFKNSRQQIDQERRALPIASARRRLVEEIRKNDTLIIVGETGSGKTTQLPQYLFDAGFHGDGVIGVTQPRRVAAIEVAIRVAEECGVTLGQKVGYAIRFEDVTSRSTKIKYMTAGLLLREALLDPYLSKYSIIVVDEAHERTVQTDVLLGLLKNIQQERSRSADVKNGNNTLEDRMQLDNKDDCQNTSILKQCNGKKCSPLKLIIMSASLDARVFSEFFGGAKAVHVQGRQYPVEVFYTYQLEKDHIEATLITIFQIHLEEDPGDILVFLTGQEEIESVERLIQEHLQRLPEASRNLIAFPIFSSLPLKKQRKVLMPVTIGFRKVILATNIAETSITIPGIKYVIDPGFVKARDYQALTGVESLAIVKTSKAQALQRSGRAGRVGPGKCYRLYPEHEFEKRPNSTTPEIKRCNLSNVILQLKARGINNIMKFQFIEEPEGIAILKSLESLHLLGALTEEGTLSDPIGQQLVRLPLDPLYSKALVLASQFNCLEEMLILVAMLSVESIFYAPQEKLEESRKALKCFSSPEGDHLTLLNVYRASEEFLKENASMNSAKAENSLKRWCKENFINSSSLKRARDIHGQILRIVQQMGLRVASCGEDMLLFRRCLAASFFLKAAEKNADATYTVLTSDSSHLVKTNNSDVGPVIVHIHPSSVLFRAKPECVIFDELVKTNNSYIHIRKVTRIDRLWLPELAPQSYATKH